MELKIKSAKYVSQERTVFGGKTEKVNVSIEVVHEFLGNDETMFVPIAVGNRHYDGIMEQVDAGTITIEEAD